MTRAIYRFCTGMRVCTVERVYASGEDIVRECNFNWCCLVGRLSGLVPFISRYDRSRDSQIQPRNRERGVFPRGKFSSYANILFLDNISHYKRVNAAQ